MITEREEHRLLGVRLLVHGRDKSLARAAHPLIDSHYRARCPGTDVTSHWSALLRSITALHYCARMPGNAMTTPKNLYKYRRDKTSTP